MGKELKDGDKTHIEEKDGEKRLFAERSLFGVPYKEDLGALHPKNDFESFVTGLVGGKVPEETRNITGNNFEIKGRDTSLLDFSGQKTHDVESTDGSKGTMTRNAYPDIKGERPYTYKEKGGKPVSDSGSPKKNTGSYSGPFESGTNGGARQTSAQSESPSAPADQKATGKNKEDDTLDYLIMALVIVLFIIGYVIAMLIPVVVAAMAAIGGGLVAIASAYYLCRIIGKVAQYFAPVGNDFSKKACFTITWIVFAAGTGLLYKPILSLLSTVYFHCQLVGFEMTAPYLGGDLSLEDTMGALLFMLSLDIAVGMIFSYAIDLDGWRSRVSKRRMAVKRAKAKSRAARRAIIEEWVRASIRKAVMDLFSK